MSSAHPNHKIFTHINWIEAKQSKKPSELKKKHMKQETIKAHKNIWSNCNYLEMDTQQMEREKKMFWFEMNEKENDIFIYT